VLELQVLQERLRQRLDRIAGMEWSFLLREAGVGHLVVPAGELPVRQDRHRGKPE
jgi:hypothetical protein